MLLIVKAIWSDAAKNLMVRAAEAAEYGTHRDDFELVSEPESAAGNLEHNYIRLSTVI